MSRPLALASLLLGVILFLNLAAPTTQRKCYVCGRDEFQSALDEIMANLRRQKLSSPQARQSGAANAEWVALQRAADKPCGSGPGKVIDCTEAYRGQPQKPENTIMECQETRTKEGRIGKFCAYVDKLLVVPNMPGLIQSHFCDTDLCNNQLTPLTGLKCYVCGAPEAGIAASQAREDILNQTFRQLGDTQAWRSFIRAANQPCGSGLGTVIDCTDSHRGRPRANGTEMACAEAKTRDGKFGRLCNFFDGPIENTSDKEGVAQFRVCDDKDLCNNRFVVSGAVRIAKTSVRLLVGLFVVAVYINRHV